MGLISRVSSRTYRECHKNITCLTKYSPTASEACEPLADPEIDHKPGFTTQCSQKVTSQTRFAVVLSLYFGTIGMTHFIHSGTNAKYSEIRNTEMYAVMKGCPIKEGYKNWEE